MKTEVLVGHLGAWSAGKGSLQQKLARALIQIVREGALNPGSRLPSERELARALTISRTTVVAAYDTLRDGGWVESRTGSGTRVSKSSVVNAARGAAQAGALAASPLLGLLSSNQDEDLIDFVLGAPLPLAGLSTDRFTPAPEEYAALINDTRYYALGLPALRQGIASYYSQAGLATRPEQILVTNGAQQGISLCAGLYLQRGDSALLEDPTYFGALDAFRAAGARLAGLAVESDGISPATLRQRIVATSPRLIYLTPTFQNPTGALMPRLARKEVARITAELGVPVIDDCTFFDLALEGSPPPPIAAFAPDAPVITIGSVSKLIWPGLRIGWVRAPEPIVEKLARLKSAMDLGSPLLTQAVAARLLSEVESIRDLRRQQLKPRRDLLASLLRNRLPNWKFRMAAGGLFLWVKLPAGDARQLAQTALRHGVVILPGPLMSPGERFAGFVR
ncbi:MAG: PLP-dependent aminotransferase family protein, partial [Acidobacteriia bacterium]|nr:PLP-dependent aminotransferase family protein [Terriglobia bacterium]